MNRITLFLNLLILYKSTALVPTVDRRQALSQASSAAFSFLATPTIATAADVESDKDSAPDYHYRDRNKNKQAVIREDYWYMTNKIPPQSLDPNFSGDEGPEYNAWGTCTTSSQGNSCTYVPLKQRIPGYSNYAFNIAFGARDYASLGALLNEMMTNQSLDDKFWNKAASYLQPAPGSTVPPPAKDALLKMVLMGTAMLTTPNYSGPPKELLVARFYVNETSFALSEISSALAAKDIKRARAAWEFGRDSWNSYFVLVNRSIVPKVGEKFEFIV